MNGTIIAFGLTVATDNMEITVDDRGVTFTSINHSQIFKSWQQLYDLAQGQGDFFTKLPKRPNALL
jgi:hypothetical protein